ncbi:MAG: iron chaperone [Christensenellales bacterium]
MENERGGYASTDEYIQSFSAPLQSVLNELRAVISKAAPDATEKISYAMPTFYLNGNLVHFAAYKNHIGFYPAPSGISAFQEELKPYKSSKGAVQFPLDKPLPLALISRIVHFRVAENQGKPKKS